MNVQARRLSMPFVQMRQHVFISVVIGVVVASGCTRPQTSIFTPPATFMEDQLIGQWSVQNPVRYTESLTLRADYTYTQIWTDKEQQVPLAVDGQWHVERRESGCIFIHLAGMRMFHGTTEGEAMNGHRYSDGTPLLFYERCENARFVMPDKVILTVGRDPRASEQVLLFFPRRSAESSDVALEQVNNSSGTQ
jgi:hypothetical protein